MTQQEFIDKISVYAVEDMGASGILASVTIAQSALESGFGTTDLAINANNLGGMKCDLSGNTWTTAWDGVSKYYKNTKEQRKDGTWYTVHAAFRKYPDWGTYIKDHSLYLVGAMKEKNKKRFAGLVGEKDPRKAIQIIKDGGYATDINYVNKVMSIINRYNLTRYDSIQIPKGDIKIIEKFAVNNSCYKSGNVTEKTGCMLHSVGCPQPDPLVFVKNWQNADSSVCVHAVVGADRVVYQLLPWDRRANHCGKGSKGSGNNNLISLEMTEPATIKYTGGANWIELGNGANTKAHVLATYRNAVDFFAKICKELDFKPLYSDVVMSHHEGNTKGIASNHGDVEHIWDKFGLSMNQFRKDILATMNGHSIETVPSVPLDKTTDEGSARQKINPLSGTVEVIYQGVDGLNLRKAPSYIADIADVVKTGSFIVVGISEDEKWYKLDNGLFITAVPSYVKFHATPEQKAITAGTGYIRVRKTWQDADSQIGAFKDKTNAINLCKNNAGYRVYDDSGKEIYPLNQKIPENKEFRVRVSIPNLRIRRGPGTTYDYHKQGGKAVYTGKGEFTIVETADGSGAKLWGLLKSYEEDRDGWIALDDGVKCFY